MQEGRRFSWPQLRWRDITDVGNDPKWPGGFGLYRAHAMDEGENRRANVEKKVPERH